MKKVSRSAALFAKTSVLALIAGVMTSPVLADEAASDVEAVRDNNDQIEEIVVTAQKRSENIQKVPIAIEAVTARQASASGVNSTVALSTAVPGLTMSPNPAGPQIYLRGIGTKATTPGSEGANAVYIDGIYIGTVPGALFQFNSIERIEVLKGPQGTLFGRNATGGAINIITPDPSFNPAVDAEIGYGNYDTVSAQLYATGALSETVAGDVAVMYEKQSEGWGENLYSGKAVGLKDTFHIRGKLLWNLSDRTTVRVSLDGGYGKSSQSGSVRQAYPGSTTSTRGARYTGDFHNINVDGEPLNSSRQVGGNIKVTHEFSGAEFVSITSQRYMRSYYNYDMDFSPAPFLTAYYPQKDRNFSQEFQLQALASSRIKWIVGAFYYDALARSDALTFTGTSQAANGGQLNKYAKLGTKSLAGYAQATVPLSEKLNLTLGARYTKDRKSIEAHDENAANVTLPASVVSASKDYNKLTYRAALDYAFSEDTMGYISYNRGYKSGEYAAAAPTNPPVNPETIDALEVGVKTQFWDNRGRFNASVFNYDYTNIQLSRVVDGSGNILYNAAGAEINGIDINLIIRPMSGLSLSLGAEYLDATYTEYPGAPITTVCDVVNTALNCPVANGFLGTSFGDVSGNYMIMSPKYSANFGVNYAWSTSFGLFNSNITYAYNDGVYWDADNRVKQPSYSLVNAQLKWTSLDGKYDVRLWGTNLGDTEYAQSASYNNGDSFSPAAPRTFGIKLGLHY